MIAFVIRSLKLMKIFLFKLQYQNHMCDSKSVDLIIGFHYIDNHDFNQKFQIQQQILLLFFNKITARMVK